MSISIGTITPLAPGSKATASLTGVAPNQVLNLGVPQNVSSAASVPVGPTQINGASVPISVNILGANTLGQIVDNSSIVLSNSTTGNSATASAPEAGSLLSKLVPLAVYSFVYSFTYGFSANSGCYNISTFTGSKASNGITNLATLTFANPLPDSNYIVVGTTPFVQTATYVQFDSNNPTISGNGAIYRFF